MASKRLAGVCATTLFILLLSHSVGCVYRLHPPQFPSERQLRIVTPSPEHFTVRVAVGNPKEYDVASDGKVKLAIPAYREGCGPYLFGIKLHSKENVEQAKTISVVNGVTVVRTLSLNDLFRLPVDSEGYFVLRLSWR